MIEDKKAYARQWYQKNKAKVLSKQRAKYKKNSAAKLEACKNYRDNNKEAVAERDAARYLVLKDDPDKIKQIANMVGEYSDPELKVTKPEDA